MAKPITPTAPLLGRDAEAFIKAAEENKNRKITPQEEKTIKDKLDRAFSRFQGMKITFGS